MEQKVHHKITALSRSRRSLMVLLGLALFALGLTIASQSTVSASAPTNMARAVSTDVAATILQHTLPEVHYANLRRSALLAPPIDLAQQEVMVSYAEPSSSATVVELHVFRVGSIQRLEQSGVVDVTIAGTPMKLFVSNVTRSDGPLTIRSYTWSHDGLSFALNVFVRPPLTAEVADAIAASVR